MSRAPVCPYCDQPAELVRGDRIYANREDLSHLHDCWYWLCAPCDAYVGCHAAGHGPAPADGKVPLGRLAKLELRRAKSAAHRAMDPWWQSPLQFSRHPAHNPAMETIGQRRRHIYRWMAGELGIDVRSSHIGMFDLDQCLRVVQLFESIRDN